MTSAVRVVQAGGLAAGVVLAMSLGGGVSFAEPVSATVPRSDPSAASQQLAGPSSSAGTSQRPTLSLELELSNGLTGSGAGQTVSDDLQAQEEKLSSNMTALDDLTTQMSAADQELDRKVAELKLQGGESLGIQDMLEMQAIMNHLNELSAIYSRLVSESNLTLEGMARNVKE